MELNSMDGGTIEIRPGWRLEVDVKKVACQLII